MKSAITVEGVGKRYRRHRADRPTTLKETVLRGFRRSTHIEVFWALRGVDVAIAPGRMVGLIGRNGAGKSTLLRLIGGVGRPDTGTIRVDGRVGALLDLGAGFHPDLTGRENMFVNGVIGGMTHAQIAQRFDDIVAFAELESFIDNPLRTYSTGMTMRLAFAIAAHSAPDVLLIDEVLAVGDIAFQRKCLERIDAFKRSGCTIVLVTHDTTAIRTLCDEVIWLRNGTIAAHGPTESVVDQYEQEMQHETRLRTPRDRASSDDASDTLRLGETRWGSMEVEIDDVTLRSIAGVEVSEIKPGDDLRVELAYSAHVPIDTPYFGVTFMHEDGTICCDLSTKVAAQLTGSGQVALELDRLDLVGGNYFVNAGIYEREWAYAYDFHWKVYRLTVDAPPSGKGFLAPPHCWRFA